VRVAGAVGLAAVLAGGRLTGCQQRVTQPPPRGDSGGRIDPYRSTSADRYDRSANTVDLLEFSDRVGDMLAQRISGVSEIRESGSRVVIEMGDIENRTSTPSNDFAIMRRRTFASLVNSDAVSRYADILEAPEVMDDQYQRFGTPGGVGTDRYNTRATYLLQGYFGELVRGGGVQSSYYYEMTLTNLQTRRIVFVEQFDTKQFRD
jgi:hypothetical protein